jgi:ABC-type multidrug transport system fused ATPase/permease subunit
MRALQAEKDKFQGVASNASAGNLTAQDERHLASLPFKASKMEEIMLALGNVPSWIPTTTPVPPYDYPWFADSTSNLYPLPILLIWVAATCFFIFLFETGWLRSTLMQRSKKSVERFFKESESTLSQVTVQIKSGAKEAVACAFAHPSLGALFEGAGMMGSTKTEQHDRHVDNTTTNNNNSQGGDKAEWSPEHTAEFWNRVDDWTKNLHKEQTTLNRFGTMNREDWDLVRFNQRSYHCSVHDGKVTIGVQRVGACTQTLKVRVETIDKDSVSTAQVKKNFKHVDCELVFEPGEALKEFDVEVIAHTQFDPAKWFRCRIASVEDDKAKTEAPDICRVFISDDFVFPANIPADKRDSRMWRMFYFVKETKEYRKEKWWKTMFALLYHPIHYVAVVSLTEKFLLDWATDPDTGNGVEWIVVLVGILFFSTVILRWADVVQTRMRGRTGGIRQLYRLQLLEKLLMMSYEDQWKVTGSQWFYSAVHDVDGLALDIYWQVFMAAQHIFGLVLTVLVLVFMTLYQERTDESSDGIQVGQFIPLLAFVILIPATILNILQRTKATSMHVLMRKKGEAAWMGVFAWLAHSCRTLYGFSAYELMELEKQFKSENTKFVKHHQAQRDFINDTSWVTQWIGEICYCFILWWASNAHHAYKAPGAEHQKMRMSAGEMVLLAGLFKSILHYIQQLNECLISLLRGEVSLGQVEMLLNSKGKDRFARFHDEAQGKIQQFEPVKPRPSQNGEDLRHHGDIIKLSQMSFMPEKGTWVGPFGHIDLSLDVEFPLGSLVRVSCSDEACRLSFLGAIAGVIHANSGGVVVPLVADKVMVTPIPHVLAGTLTVHQAFTLAGASQDDGLRLAHILGLDPEHVSEHLPPGGIQCLSLGRALLRDPEVLVMARPLAYVPLALRTRMACLLRLWQACGGMQPLLHRLSVHHEMHEDLKSTHDGERLEVVSKTVEKRLLASGTHLAARTPLRTLVVCEEDVPSTVHLDTDICIDLDAVARGSGGGHLRQFMMENKERSNMQLGTLGHPADDHLRKKLADLRKNGSQEEYDAMMDAAGNTVKQENGAKMENGSFMVCSQCGLVEGATSTTI